MSIALTVDQRKALNVITSWYQVDVEFHDVSETRLMFQLTVGRYKIPVGFDSDGAMFFTTQKTCLHESKEYVEFTKVLLEEVSKCLHKTLSA